jgi:hypothetical protein
MMNLLKCDKSKVYAEAIGSILGIIIAFVLGWKTIAFVISFIDIAFTGFAIFMYFQFRALDKRGRTVDTKHLPTAFASAVAEEVLRNTAVQNEMESLHKQYPSGDYKSFQVVQAIAGLKSSDSQARWSAARRLRELPNPRAIDPLIQALADSDWNVAIHAAQALSNIGNRRAIGPLFRALEQGRFGNQSELVDSHIAIQLGKLGDARVIDRLTRISTMVRMSTSSARP